MSTRDFDSRINELLGLKDGWFDGEGKKISDKALESAKILQQALIRHGKFDIPYLYPTSGGGIRAEWPGFMEDSGIAAELTATFNQDGSIFWACIDDAYYEKYLDTQESDISIDTIIEILDNFNFIQTYKEI